MSYWGCATFPNIFLGSRADVIELISESVPRTGNLRTINQKVISSSPAIVESSSADSYRTAISYQSVAEFMADAEFARSIGLSAVSTIYSSEGIVNPTQEQVSESINDNLATSAITNLSGEQIIEASSVLIPVQVAPDMYYWVRFEQVEKDDNTTEFS